MSACLDGFDRAAGGGAVGVSGGLDRHRRAVGEVDDHFAVGVGAAGDGAPCNDGREFMIACHIRGTPIGLSRR